MINLFEKYIIGSTSILNNLIYLTTNVYLYFVYNLFFLAILILVSFFCFFFREKPVIWDMFRWFLDPYNDLEWLMFVHKSKNNRDFFFYTNNYLKWLHFGNGLFYERAKKTGIYIYNFLFLLFAFLFYLNCLFYNTFYFFIVWFCKKFKLLNLNFDWVISFDYINFYFVIITSFIFFMIYLTIFNVKFKKDFQDYKLKSIFFFFLVIEVSLIFTFSTSNIFFFFFFFECSLIPMYFLVQLSGKGTKKKQYAGLSLVFFTLFGSIFLLFGILYITSICKSCDFKNLNFELIDFNSQILLFLFFFIGFSVKAPIFPFYSWLPEAHVEASTAVSILLAAIFLKIATYGLLKIVIFNFFIISIFYYSLIFYFSIMSILIATILVLIQTDLKKIIALSSIIHMNYMIIAIFTLDSKAIIGSFIYMFSHAFISTGLFFLIGVLYENTGTRDLLNFSNFYKYNSKMYFFFFFFNLANVSFPLLVSFISELIILNNMLYYNFFIVILILFSIFFSIIYTFWMVHNVFFGKILIKKNFFYLNKFDVFFLMFLFLIIVILGIAPSLILYNLEQELYLILINKLSIY